MKERVLKSGSESRVSRSVGAENVCTAWIASLKGGGFLGT